MARAGRRGLGRKHQPCHLPLLRHGQTNSASARAALPTRAVSSVPQSEPPDLGAARSGGHWVWNPGPCGEVGATRLSLGELWQAACGPGAAQKGRG